MILSVLKHLGDIVMIEYIKVLTTVISLLLTLYSTYFIIFALFSFKKNSTYKHHLPTTKFAIVIAARNEENVIADLIDSLHSQNYPRELYDIYVVPNNCTDNTTEKALAAGALILECQYPVKTKGDVLSQTFDQLNSNNKQYDAFCVFDADNIVESDFLIEANHAFKNGVRVAQGYRQAKNPYDTWITGSYNIYFMIMNRFINKAKSNAGLSAYLSGTGFMINVDVLKKSKGWRTTTISEDTEFSLICMLNNERIDWMPKAIIYDEQPLTLTDSIKQRTRWSSGAMQLLLLYFKKMIKQIRLHNVLQIIDGLMSLMAVYIQLLSILQLLLIIFISIVYNHNSFLIALMPLFVSYLTMTMIAMIVLILEKKWNKQCLRSVLSFWIFVMSWSFINLHCLFNKTTKWTEIKHYRSIKVTKLNTSGQEL